MTSQLHHADSSTPGIDTLHGSILSLEMSVGGIPEGNSRTISATVVTTHTSAVYGNQMDTNLRQSSVSQATMPPPSQSGVLHDVSEMATQTRSNPPTLVSIVDTSMAADLQVSATGVASIISSPTGLPTAFKVIAVNATTTSTYNSSGSPSASGKRF